MLFNFPELLKEFDVKISGLIHVGSHEAGEIEVYSQLGIQNVLLIEANPYRFRNLVETLTVGRVNTNCSPLQYKQLPEHLAKITKQYKACNYAIVDKDIETVTLHLSSSDGGMDSIYNINEEGSSRSWCRYSVVGRVDVPAITLDTLMKESTEYNFLNIDVEGAELDVLKGSEKLLKHIDYIMLETQDIQRFHNTPTSKEIDQFLTSHGFIKRKYFDTTMSWGDAFYIKTKQDK